MTCDKSFLKQYKVTCLDHVAFQIEVQVGKDVALIQQMSRYSN